MWRKLYIESLSPRRKNRNLHSSHFRCYARFNNKLCPRAIFLGINSNSYTKKLQPLDHLGNNFFINSVIIKHVIWWTQKVFALKTGGLKTVRQMKCCFWMNGTSINSRFIAKWCNQMCVLISALFSVRLWSIKTRYPEKNIGSGSFFLGLIFLQCHDCVSNIY